MELNEPTLGVLLADDHAMVRIGLQALLARFPRVKVLGAVSNAAEVTKEVRRLRPDVVLLDVVMPGKSGFEVCREIHALGLGTRVVLLTSFIDDEGIRQAVDASADGILLKDTTPEELLKAITSAAMGVSTVSPQIAQRMMQLIKTGHPQVAADSFQKLTPREKRVLSLVAEGKTNKEIGAVIGLSPRSANNYFSCLLAKLGLTSRSEAAAYYARHAAPGHHHVTVE